MINVWVQGLSTYTQYLQHSVLCLWLNSTLFVEAFFSLVVFNFSFSSTTVVWVTSIFLQLLWTRDPRRSSSLLRLGFVLHSIHSLFLVSDTAPPLLQSTAQTPPRLERLTICKASPQSPYLSEIRVTSLISSFLPLRVFLSCLLDYKSISSSCPVRNQQGGTFH